MTVVRQGMYSSKIRLKPTDDEESSFHKYIGLLYFNALYIYGTFNMVLKWIWDQTMS